MTAGRESRPFFNWQAKVDVQEYEVTDRYGKRLKRIHQQAVGQKTEYIIS